MWLLDYKYCIEREIEARSIFSGRGWRVVGLFLLSSTDQKTTNSSLDFDRWFFYQFWIFDVFLWTSLSQLAFLVGGCCLKKKCQKSKKWVKCANYVFFFKLNHIIWPVILDIQLYFFRWLLILVIAQIWRPILDKQYDQHIKVYIPLESPFH